MIAKPLAKLIVWLVKWWKVDGMGGVINVDSSVTAVRRAWYNCPLSERDCLHFVDYPDVQTGEVGALVRSVQLVGLVGWELVKEVLAAAETNR